MPESWKGTRGPDGRYEPYGYVPCCWGAVHYGRSACYCGTERTRPNPDGVMVASTDSRRRIRDYVPSLEEVEDDWGL
jgi:hypothetical protein